VGSGSISAVSLRFRSGGSRCCRHRSAAVETLIGGVVVPTADRDAAFATLHAALAGLARVMAPLLPFLTEAMHQNLVVAAGLPAPDSVHLTRWPTDELAPLRDEELEAATARTLRAVELARTLRSQAGLKTRQPLARLWIALPGAAHADLDALLGVIAEEVNVKEVIRIGDESELVERRIKPLLPKIGRKLGAAIPAVMAAARKGAFEVRADGSVALAGVVLAPDEVEILASPRQGTAVAHDDGLVVVISAPVTRAADGPRCRGECRRCRLLPRCLAADVSALGVCEPDPSRADRFGGRPRPRASAGVGQG